MWGLLLSGVVTEHGVALRYGPGNQVPVSLSEARGVGVAYTVFGNAKGWETPETGFVRAVARAVFPF